METKGLIYRKLETFIRKYYTNDLIKGTILFTGIGLLYFLFTLFVEYFLWLKPLGRTILFWSFIGVEAFLFLRFILFPVFKLFKLKRGIDYYQASEIIGTHFQEVGDKLTNFLQLSNDKRKSELLLASIEQKADNLSPVNFSNAISFKGNKRYIPWVVLPGLIIVFFFITGRINVLSDSMSRVVQYNVPFSPPAPFQFLILNETLVNEQGNDFVLRVKTEGKVIPEHVLIKSNGESYFMESSKPGHFEYVFKQLQESRQFSLEANKVRSADFILEAIPVPVIGTFEMELKYPSYLKRTDEVIRGTGNAIVPEGTQVFWKILTAHTEKVLYSDNNDSFSFAKEENQFSFSKKVKESIDYQIVTSNSHAKDYEQLQYQLQVVKDQYPTIDVMHAPDSLKLDSSVLIGQVSDDYGLTRLQLVYYPQGQKEVKKHPISVSSGNFDQFSFSFPGNLSVEEGKVYEYYFEVFDNDRVNNFKSSRSVTFSSRIKTQGEMEEEVLQEKNANINSFEKTLRDQDKQLKELDQLKKLGKEKTNLDYKEQRKVKEFLERQKQQEQMMKEFSRKLEKNLNDFKTEQNDLQKEALQERLKRTEEQAEKNQKLLDELQRLSEKLQEEELFDKMDRFKQQSQSQKRNLEQLVELTKRFYVEKKSQQIAEKLDKLADEQENLSKKDEADEKEQDALNDKFEDLKKELDQLEKDNENLKEPMDLGRDKQGEDSIEDDMKKASDDLKKEEQEKANKNQKKAAQKMKQMSQQMMMSMSGGGMEMMQEDARLLRQILDNLLAFSFLQEDVMKEFRALKKGAPSYNKHLKSQQDLRTQFKHVDDSLFALSLRNPMITEAVTYEIGEVYYNIDKSLENLSEAIVHKGVSHQQYTISSSNRLADMLSDVLNSMQLSMSGSGSGGQGNPKPGGKEKQLPDIIQKQLGLSEEMRKGIEKKMKGEGEDGDEGEKKGNKEQGQGSEGKSGEMGDDGEEQARELMEIFKEQRKLRQQLEDELRKNGLSPDGTRVLDQMKDVEKQILNKGFRNEVFQKMLNIKYEMLKLENALQQQGEDSKRESQTNEKDYSNSAKPLSKELQEYLNSVEILNRQSLPLRPDFNQRIQTYFKKND